MSHRLPQEAKESEGIMTQDQEEGRNAEELDTQDPSPDDEGNQEAPAPREPETATDAMDAVIEVFNAYQRKMMSEDTKRGLRHEASLGHFVSGKAPFGYRKVAVQDGTQRRFTLELDPETSPTVRRIYDLYLADSSDRNTARQLNDEQVPSPNGEPWTPRRVKNIRQNQVNCGVYRFGKRSSDGPVQVPDAFPAIVSQEEFERAQRMEERR